MTFEQVRAVDYRWSVGSLSFIYFKDSKLQSGARWQSVKLCRFTRPARDDSWSPSVAGITSGAGPPLAGHASVRRGSPGAPSSPPYRIRSVRWYASNAARERCSTAKACEGAKVNREKRRLEAAGG